MKFIKLTNNDNLIKATIKILDTNPDMLLKDYLSNILKDFDKTCDNFIKFYKKLFNHIIKFDPMHRLYGLIL